MTLSEAQDYWKLSDQQVDAIWRLLLAHERILPGGQIGYSMADLEWAIEWLGINGVPWTPRSRRRAAA